MQNFKIWNRERGIHGQSDFEQFSSFLFLNDLDKKDKTIELKYNYNVYTFVSQIFPMG